MATQISLKNLTSSSLSVSAKLDEDRAISELLAGGETKAISGVQLDELDASAEIQDLISGGKLQLVLVDGPVMMKRYSLVASGPADVALSLGLEHKMQLLDSMLVLSTGGTGTAQLFDEPAGAGNALSSAMDQSGTGRVVDASTATSELAANSQLHLLRGGADSVGELILTLQRLS